MKNLANCTIREFIAQTNRIRHAAERWLNLTQVLEIRANLPKADPNATEAEKRRALEAQIKKNGRAMLDAVLEKHAEETAELLGLMCFIEPDDLDNHSMRELLGAFAEMIGCREVVDFFISLARLAQTDISDTART